MLIRPPSAQPHPKICSMYVVIYCYPTLLQQQYSAMFICSHKLWTNEGHKLTRQRNRNCGHETKWLLVCCTGDIFWYVTIQPSYKQSRSVFRKLSIKQTQNKQRNKIAFQRHSISISFFKVCLQSILHIFVLLMNEPKFFFKEMVCFIVLWKCGDQRSTFGCLSMSWSCSKSTRQSVLVMVCFLHFG